MRSLPVEQLKKLLLDQSVLSAEDFDLAVKDSFRMGQDIIDVLVARNFIQSCGRKNTGFIFGNF